jgi:subtilisin family serine protease
MPMPDQAEPLPDRIYAHASPRSIGGTSMFEAGRIDSGNVQAFYSEQDVVTQSITLLREHGFEILQVTPLTINFAGSPEQFARAFNTSLVDKPIEVVKPGGVHDIQHFIDSTDTEMLGFVATTGTRANQLIEGIAIEEKRQYMALPSPLAPSVSYWHLSVPGDVAACCGATPIHGAGITGTGVRVAMVDSGWYAHPFFAAHGYAAAPVLLGPGADSPESDESGHGGGESGNVFSLAPNAGLLPVKMSPINSTGAFNAAAGLRPDVITCSWGSSRPLALSAVDLVLSAAIANAVAMGITVVFSAGNGHAGFPGQHPDVISAGGVFVDEDGSVQASNYASAFDSQIFAGRHVPDVCGLVGMRPKAIYIMLPIQPGSKIDVDNSASAGPFPLGDETAPDDGWGAFSGTSAAAPQVAGAVALIKQAYPYLTPADVRLLLTSTAMPVVRGTSSPVDGLHQGFPAMPGPLGACGYGLMNVGAALAAVPALQAYQAGAMAALAALGKAA